MLSKHFLRDALGGPRTMAFDTRTITKKPLSIFFQRIVNVRRLTEETNSKCGDGTVMTFGGQAGSDGNSFAAACDWTHRSRAGPRMGWFSYRSSYMATKYLPRFSWSAENSRPIGPSTRLKWWSIPSGARPWSTGLSPTPLAFRLPLPSQKFPIDTSPRDFFIAVSSIFWSISER